MTMRTSPQPPATAVEGDQHRQTTELVRASLICGVRYGKYGPTRDGAR